MYVISEIYSMNTVEIYTHTSKINQIHFCGLFIRILFLLVLTCSLEDCKSLKYEIIL